MVYPITIIIPVYSTQKKQISMTKKVIASVKKAVTGEYEIIVIDDKSPVFYDFSGKNIRFIKRKKNMGISHNWNLGIRKAKYENICIMNSDVIIHKGCFEALYDAFLKDDLGFTFPTPIECEEDKERRYVGTYIEGQRFAPCFLSNKKTYDFLAEDGMYFDENITPCWFEDYDMWKRAENANVMMRSTTKAFVEHIGGGHQTVDLKEDKKKIFEKNKKYYLNKHNLNE